MQVVQDLWSLIKPHVKIADRSSVAYELLQTLEDNNIVDVEENDSELHNLFGMDDDFDEALNEFLDLEDDQEDDE